MLVDSSFDNMFNGHKGDSIATDIPDFVEQRAPEQPMGSESTGVSPLTMSLGNNLTLEEDSNSIDKMCIATPGPEVNNSVNESPSQELSDTQNEVNNAENLKEPGPFLSADVTLNNILDNNKIENNSVEDNIPIDDCAEAGVCGLQNLGNTCFMAAGLQCLTATPPVMRHFLKFQQQEYEKAPATNSLMAHFSSLVSKMWSGKYNVLQPTQFKQTLGVYHSQFKDYRQHDCQEFLALLLDSLHEQMNLAKLNKICAEPSSSIRWSDNIETELNEKLGVDTAEPMSSCDEKLMDYPNSPNVTMVGSPREFPEDELYNIDASPLNNEDNLHEAQNSDEISATKSNFIRNDTHDFSIRDPSQISKFDDIAKDAKTSNANFLVTPQECNNEIHYDSQKYPRENTRRLILENSNLTENHDFNNKTVSIRRIKEVNVAKNVATCCEPFAINTFESDCSNSLGKCNVKRIRLEEHEKNYRLDKLKINNRVQCSNRNDQENGNAEYCNEVEANKHWENHLKSNRSIIVDTFQGQFKSTVVCSACGNISITYEPFMYLSVPLPYAMEKQFTVTYIPAHGKNPIRCVMSLNKQYKVSQLKEKLLKILDLKDTLISNIEVAEVLDNHISRVIEDSLLLRYAETKIRCLYAFEMIDPPNPYTEMETDSDAKESPSIPFIIKDDIEAGAAGEESGICIICFDEMVLDLKKHSEPSCKFIACSNCLENFFKKEAENSCPMCKKLVTISSFVEVDQTSRPMRMRMLNVPIILRHDTDEATNNRKSTKLFGYPHLLKLPSMINAKDLWNVVKQVVPDEISYSLHFVNHQGIGCSRCMFPKHCTGCKVPKTGLVTLHNCDALALRYTEGLPEIKDTIDHISYKQQRIHERLSLYDCLRAFCQSETLDENNPWFCPKCKQNQCATKTLTIYRYPKFLIVYLKRFVFYECMSMKLDDKVTFPLQGLKCGNHHYDLYACVCHFGGVTAGHYTAYAKKPETDVWHYYNDDMIMRRKPEEEEYSNAYILFYSQQEFSKQNNR